MFDQRDRVKLKGAIDDLRALSFVSAALTRWNTVAASVEFFMFVGKLWQHWDPDLKIPLCRRSPV